MEVSSQRRVGGNEAGEKGQLIAWGREGRVWLGVVSTKLDPPEAGQDLVTQFMAGLEVRGVPGGEE